ncbi:cell wall hydrolase [Sphingosinicella sp. BN140058]|uniref:cell wall hydrolase n=1 Tax=Sphingosinicella sp. BN140058 TaxID=1892855 RepID=UPI00101022E2|nr:cell wall hydrolase [Sphingosinicella sp. BN140058]QAY78455.1 cell wall hydrolase [Sphingosinicella sp. BN140058]
MSDSLIVGALREALHGRGREIAALGLLLFGASCVPLGASPRTVPQTFAAEMVSSAIPAAPDPRASAPAMEVDAMGIKPVSAGDAVTLNAAIPFAAMPNPRASATVFRAGSVVDQQRSLQCLAEAVYYEARSESEDGQRAVAQVVLNRARHPAYPGTVCGVVYQGPLKAGGGCQFTFTCDGSLGQPPSGVSWLRARRIASEALAGSVYAGVGYATHYHTQQVLPFWAYKLAKVAVVGSHNFYRMPGDWGAPAAFRRLYAGREPSPAVVIANRLPANFPKAVPAAPTPARLPYAIADLAGPSRAAPRLALHAPVDEAPVSTVREEYRNSGRYLSDIPPAETVIR